jgi:hypothetical protein
LEECRCFVPRLRRPVTAVATVDAREVVDRMEREPGVWGLDMDMDMEGVRGARWKLESGRPNECRLVVFTVELEGSLLFPIRTWFVSAHG